MTAGVVMLLTGPMQSWGGPVAGVYERPTGPRPSLSAVVGIIANALGRERTDSIDDIAKGAQLAVRVDRHGSLLHDFHTIGTPGRYALIAGAGRQQKNPVVTNKYYLSDAAFLVVYTPPPDGLAADDVMAALLNPQRPLYLGRRSCVPGERIPVCTTDEGQTPEDVLTQAKLLCRAPSSAQASSSFYYEEATGSEATVSVLLELTAPHGTNPMNSIHQDAPSSFDQRRLYHLNRPFVTKTVALPVSACAGRGRDAVTSLYESLGVIP